MRSGLTREELPPAPAQDSASSRPSRFRDLFGAESLPEAPSGSPGGPPSILAVLFSRDALPLDPERKRTHRNWLAFLFAPERLDPPGGAGTEVH